VFLADPFIIGDLSKLDVIVCISSSFFWLSKKFFWLCKELRSIKFVFSRFVLSFSTPSTKVSFSVLES